MKENNKYVANVSINQFNLDKDILEQAQLYYEWAIKATEAEIEKDNLKDIYDLTIIEIEKRIRKKPERYLPKNQNITEAAIKNAVNSNKEVKNALKRYNKARGIHKILAKAEKAFEQRKKMIELYVFRHHKEKTSEVKVPRKYTEKLENEMRDNINDDLKKSIRRRR